MFIYILYNVDGEETAIIAESMSEEEIASAYDNDCYLSMIDLETGEYFKLNAEALQWNSEKCGFAVVKDACLFEKLPTISKSEVIG